MIQSLQKKRFPSQKKKILRWILLLALIVLIRSGIAHNFQLNTSIQIQSGDTAQRFFSSLGFIDRTRVKRYLRGHDDMIKNIQVGYYIFSGTYSPKTFVETIAK
jgi:cell division protein YceG involved in septum cleavage